MYFKPLDDLNLSKLDRIPAYSYPTIADSVLSGIVKGLKAHGYSELMTQVFITSKILRCELDGSLEDSLEKLGKKLADKVADSYRQDCERWAEELIYENITNIGFATYHAGANHDYI